jgi:KDO2-lipid IV(A) lauroyltransferase
LLPAGFRRLGVTSDIVYRAANNPLIDWLYRHGRSTGASNQIRKGPSGVRQLLAAMRQGHNVAMLVDQKMNDGIAVPFFGRPAMTAPAVAELALRFGCPLIPVRMERLGGTRFRVTVLPPLDHPDSGDRRQDVLTMMTEINALLESWIRERPEQWLWLHNRWPDAAED